jgi:hypothetical protein
MPTKTLEGKIAKGEVIVAECDGVAVGYCIGADRYFKREDVGVIYQMNVEAGKQRSFVGAALLKAMFDRAAYGCKLFCCWCAQDIEANKFWEAMGFLPLAFRAGSESKSRVHIFWQKRIRAGDVATPYWFPSQTSGGSIREDRLVLPIPPGTHWSDAKPMILPKEQPAEKQLQGKKDKAMGPTPMPRQKPTRPVLGKALWFAAPVEEQAKAEKPPKPKREKRKNDPKLIAAARELRDRWLEQVNADGGEALLLPGGARGKYEVSRGLEAGASPEMPRLVESIAA